MLDRRGRGTTDGLADETMKKTPTLLGVLARHDLTELVLSSGQRPRGKTRDGTEPLGEVLSADAILDLLFAAGGSRYVESLEAKPTHWRTRIDGVGPVQVSAVQKGDAIEARIVPLDRGVAARPREAEPAQGKRSKARQSIAAKPAARRSATVPALNRRVSKPPPRPREPGCGAPPTTRRTPVPAGPDRDADTVPSRAARGALPTVRLARLLVDARNARAAELHLVPGRPPLVRLGGELVGKGDALDRTAIETLLGAVIGPAELEALSADGACRLVTELVPVGRIRVDVARERGGLGASFRMLRSELPKVEELGVPASVMEWLGAPRGLIVVASPPGGGKSTIAGAMLEALAADRARSIVVLADPVEVPIRSGLSLLVHRAPSEDASAIKRGGAHDMAEAIRTASSPWPDVLGVDPLRDAEELAAAIDACDAGSLVVVALEAAGPHLALSRMITWAGPRGTALRKALARSLLGVVWQRPARGQGARAELETLSAGPLLARWIETDGGVDPSPLVEAPAPRPPRKETVPLALEPARRREAP